MEPSTSESNESSRVTNDFQTLNAEYQALRKIFLLVLASMLLLAGALDIYLFAQLRVVRKDLDSLNNAVAEYEQKEAPIVNGFVSNLVVFSKSHPDFNPIVQKYNLTLPPPKTVPQPPGVR